MGIEQKEVFTIYHYIMIIKRFYLDFHSKSLKIHTV